MSDLFWGLLYIINTNTSATITIVINNSNKTKCKIEFNFLDNYNSKLPKRIISWNFFFIKYNQKKVWKKHILNNVRNWCCCCFIKFFFGIQRDKLIACSCGIRYMDQVLNWITQQICSGFERKNIAIFFFF